MDLENSKKCSGFTLMELLIVIALIALIAAGLLVLINPMQQFAKSHDAKRKFELDALRRAFEDYYNDKGCYPLPEEVCYDQAQNVCDTLKTTTSKVCHICGLGPTPTAFPNFAPYMSQLPCDPQHPSRDYLYQVEVKCSRDADAPGDPGTCEGSTSGCSTCPKWYKIFTDFSVKNDNDSISSGCYEGGCGLTNQLGYDYGVSSGNIPLSSVFGWFCFVKRTSTCHTCGDPNRDGTANTHEDCVANTGCDQDEFYPTVEACCLRRLGGPCP